MITVVAVRKEVLMKDKELVMKRCKQKAPLILEEWSLTEAMELTL